MRQTLKYARLRAKRFGDMYGDFAMVDINPRQPRGVTARRR